jgi:hypothetical protein
MKGTFQLLTRARMAVGSLLVLSVLSTFAQGSKADYERAANLSRQFSGKVFRDRVQPNWEAGNTSFWYEVKTARDASEFIWINALTGERKKLDRAPDGRATNSASGASRGGNRAGSDTSLTFINRTPGEV